MASVGTILTSPESGWRRYDDTDSSFQYTGSGWTDSTFFSTGKTGSTTKCNSSPSSSTTIFFKFKGTKLRTYGAGYASMNNGNAIIIDGVSYNMGLWSQIPSNCIGVSFEITNLLDTVHTVQIVYNNSSRIYFDAIDIDSTGYLLTEEYLENTKPPVKPELVLDFPVKVSDDTITSESDVATYAATIINGEKQLLVADKLKSMYVTNGTGGYTKVSSVIKFDNKDTLDKFNINDNNKLTWNDSILYTEEDIKALNIKATNIVVNIKDGDINTTKTLQEILDDILTNGIQITTKAVCGTAICGNTTCGDL